MEMGTSRTGLAGSTVAPWKEAHLSPLPPPLPAALATLTAEASWTRPPSQNNRTANETQGTVYPCVFRESSLKPLLEIQTMIEALLEIPKEVLY